MATWLDHATWFFDSAWGDLIVGIGVPVLSAGSAAYLVIRQIRLADQYRVSDRRAEAVATMAEAISNAATLSIDEERVGQMGLHQFRTNELMARAYGLLGKAGHPVGLWVAAEIVHLNEQTAAWALDAIEKGDDNFDGFMGERRFEIQQIGAQAIQTILQWQGESLTTEHFKTTARPRPKGTVAATVIQAK